jgi:hypothetical protein
MIAGGVNVSMQTWLDIVHYWRPSRIRKVFGDYIAEQAEKDRRNA